MGAVVQHAKRYTVPNGGTLRVYLPANVALEKLTVWATAGIRALTNMTFQPQLNGANFGTSTVITAAVVNAAIYQSTGTRDQLLMPKLSAEQGLAAGVDPLEFSILMTNAHSSPESVTLIFLGIQHQD
jgi:hypothetical protein